mgnify:CR=1 FL=1
MSDFLACVAIEQGGYWITAGTVFVAVVILFVVGLCFQTLKAALGSPHSGIFVQLRDWAVAIAGPLSTLVLIIAMLLLLLIPIAGVWWIYDRFSDHYSVNFDAQGMDTLESMRLALKNDPNTHLTVIIADNLKPFNVQGTFDGACVADLFDAVCRAYPSDLRCSRSYETRTLTVSTP